MMMMRMRMAVRKKRKKKKGRQKMTTIEQIKLLKIHVMRLNIGSSLFTNS
jgi:transcriptional regulator NrdR family protein